MAPANRTDPAIHALTLGEVTRQQCFYEQKRRGVVDELARIFRDRQANGPAPQPMTDGVKRARARAAEMLNGSTPSSLKLPVAVDREEILLIEREAIDIVLKAMRDQEVVARVAAAATW